MGGRREQSFRHLSVELRPRDCTCELTAMAHRAFTDANGVHWQVWPVVPQWADRRTGKTRRFRPTDDPDVDPPVLEQRRGQERRRGLPDAIPRVKLTGGLEGGWLAFESSRERRRLAPIPQGWESATDAELDRMCRQSVPAAQPRRLVE